MPRVVVVANKAWEAEPLCAVLKNSNASPSGVTFTPTNSLGLRGHVDLNGTDIEIWCLQDLLAPGDGSRTDKKWEKLQDVIFAGEKPALTFAFGTATSVEPQNGSVVSGTRTFQYDAAPPGSPSRWSHPSIGTVVRSLSGERLYSTVSANSTFRIQVESRFIVPPLNPAIPPIIMLSAAYVALGDVNVVNYDDYSWADHETLAAFSSADQHAMFGSLETSHGLVRLASDSPFIFVSGLANRLGRFNEEVAPRVYAQNFVASHNAAIALAHMLPIVTVPSTLLEVVEDETIAGNEV